jgi:hypothetical protein
MPTTRAQPWLSVLVPVYKVEAWLRECLESVLAQADEGVEILVLDDASPDASMAIVHRLQQRHPGRLRTLAHPLNRGPAAARNALMHAASGRYLWFLDSDDVMLPGAITGLRSIVARDAPDLVLCDFVVLRDRTRMWNRLRGNRRRRSFSGPGQAGDSREALLAGLLESGQLHPWSKIATAEAWRAVRFPEGRYFEDVAVIAPLCQAVRHWIHVRQPWIGYREHGGSIMAQMTPVKMRDLLEAMQALHDGVVNMPGGVSMHTRRALDGFCLRTFGLLARRVPHDDQVMTRDCLAAKAAVFPHGMPRLLSTGRVGSGMWRAWRDARSLSRRGWRH